jgi:5-methyltetrahydrofolate--homocysteine methyltransferase
MAYVASEMQRDEYFRLRKIPLLIGGATTSRVHTAVKIAPHYEGPVIYVSDASRSVGVAQSLVSDQAERFLAGIRAEYEKVREQHANRKAAPLISLEQARANAPRIDWSAYVPPRPKFIGRREIRNQDLFELAHFIDWQPFFQTWDLHGSFPAILNDEVVGESARRLHSDATSMLKRLIEGRWLTANAVVGFWPANSVGDDIVLYADEQRDTPVLVWHNLRQQTAKREGVHNKCLADFVAPRSSGVADYVGVFAVTAGIGIEKQEARFAALHDDYSSIMLKALADRLAEAFAESLHQRVRQDLWGYARDEALDNQALIAEAYRGIRPAPGYPACPEHTVKRDMFELLQAERVGLTLTESLAMNPASSVSGFYIAHPDAEYFNVGPVGEDQLLDLAARSHRDANEVRRAVLPNIAG